MPLTANRDLDRYVDRELRSLPVDAGAHVRRGAWTGLTAGGHARPLAPGDAFAGVAYEEIDNTGQAAGDQRVRVYTLGDFHVPLAGTTAADIGRPVFALDDEAAALHAPDAPCVGLIRDVPGAGQTAVRIETGPSPLHTITHAVEDLAAGNDISLRAVHHFSTAAWLARARVVNQSIDAAGINDANPCVITINAGGTMVVIKTFNSTSPFPAANNAADLGPLSLPRITAGTTVTLSVIGGPTADPGAFLVQLDYA